MAEARTAKERIDAAKIHILINYPFWSTLLLRLETKPSEKTKKIATNGRTLFYNPEHIQSLMKSETVAEIVHVLHHLLFLHLSRKSSRDKKQWDKACDYAINPMIKDEGFTLPKNHLYDEKFRGLAAEQIYELIRQQENQASGNKSSNGKGGKGKQKSQPSQGDSDGDGNSGSQEGQGEGDQNSSSDETLDDHSMWGSSEDEFDEDEWREAVAQAAITAKQQGKLPGHLESLVEDLLHPKLDWRSLLRDQVQSSIKSNYRMMPPNKKHAWRGIYLPSLDGMKVVGAFIIDTSGSMSDDEIRDGLSEVRGICEAFDDFELHIIQCDAQVQEHVVITPFDGEIPKKAKGRGGTDFRPPFKFIEDNNIDADINFAVYMTDGYGTFPEVPPEYTTVWLVTTEAKTPWGVHIEYPRQVPSGKR